MCAVRPPLPLTRRLGLILVRVAARLQIQVPAESHLCLQAGSLLACHASPRLPWDFVPAGVTCLGKPLQSSFEGDSSPSALRLTTCLPLLQVLPEEAA